MNNPSHSRHVPKILLAFCLLTIPLGLMLFQVAHAKPLGGTFDVNSSGDTNAADSELTLCEAILIAKGGTGVSGLNRTLTDAEKAQLSGCSFGGTTNNWTIVSGCGAGYDTIFFILTLTETLLTAPLPTITANGTYIDGSYVGWMINGAGISSGTALTIHANDVTILHMSIMNSQSYDIIVTGSKRVQLKFNYLGLPFGATSCSFPERTRTFSAGIRSGGNTNGTSNLGDSSLYIYGNVIGCHDFYGNGIESTASNFVYIGYDPSLNHWANSIGVAAIGGAPLPNYIGVTLFSCGPSDDTHYTFIGENEIAYNTQYGVELYGPKTSSNWVQDTTIHDNGRDGICESDNAYGNAITRVSMYQNGMGINLNGDCLGSNPEVFDGPTPIITSVVRAGSMITISGVANVALSLEPTQVDVYRVSLDRNGFPEGKTFVGSTMAPLLTNGAWSLVDTSTGPVCYTTTQTITDVFPAATSEFSPSSCRLFLPLIAR